MLVKNLDCFLNMAEMTTNYYFLLDTHQQRQKNHFDIKFVKQHAKGTELRQWLLSLKPMEPFSLPLNLKKLFDSKKSSGQILMTSIYVEYLARWQTQSRRVYQLPGHLSQIFPVIKMNNIKWEEITFPFKCFCIIPERPLIGPKGERYEFIIVNIDNNEIGVLLLTDKLSIFNEPGPANNLIKLCKSIDHWSQQILSVDSSWCTYFGMRIKNEETISDSIETHKRTIKNISKNTGLVGHQIYDEIGAEVIRLVCGFTQYLQIKNINKVIQTLSPLPKSDSSLTNNIRKLSDITEITCVGNVLRLTPEVIKILDESYAKGESTRSLSPTFVSSYWRAPWDGLKNNLPKTILIGPFFRGLSLLNTDETAVGTFATTK